MSLQEKIQQLKPVIKSSEVLRGLGYVINRVEEFNKKDFPFKITEIGIGGSSIRVVNPRDIDILIKAYGVKSKWKEWNEFKKILYSNWYNLGKLISDLSKSEKRVTIDKLIKRYENKLLSLGFKEQWIKKWLPYVRISDIRWSLDRIFPLVNFSEDKLISRFLKEGWKGKRLEIHISLFDPGGKSIGIKDDVPFLIIWKIKKNVVVPTVQKINNFLKEENKKLVALSKKIIETVESEKEIISDIPEVYHLTLWILKNNDHSKLENFRNVIIELITEKINEIRDLIKKEYSTETNTNLRKCLKDFVLIGYVYTQIVNFDKIKLYKTLKSKNFHEIIEIISKRLRVYHYSKNDVKRIFKMLDLNTLLIDLEKIIKNPKINNQ